MRAFIIEPPPDAGAASRPLWKRLAWFVSLAVASAAGTAALAYLLKALLR